MQDPNSKTFQTIFKNKQRLHFFLYAELIYVVILLLTVIYAFPIFMRLIVIQFAVIAIISAPFAFAVFSASVIVWEFPL